MVTIAFFAQLSLGQQPILLGMTMFRPSLHVKFVGPFFKLFTISTLPPVERQGQAAVDGSSSPSRNRAPY
jgi:hypothetical protein